jgi:hypothetical protein
MTEMSSQKVEVEGLGCIGPVLLILMSAICFLLLCLSLDLNSIKDAIEANTAACSQQELPK